MSKILLTNFIIGILSISQTHLLCQENYIPVDPIPVVKVWEVLKDDKTFRPMTNLEINTSLPHQSLNYVYKVIKKEQRGSLGYKNFIDVSALNKGDTVEVVGEWSKYMVDFNSPNDPLFLYRIGVGVRTTFILTIKNTSADISSVFSIAASAKEEMVDGSLTLSVMGLDSELITSLVPNIPSKISPEAIESVLSNVSFIKAQLYNEKTKVTPSIIGFQALVDNTTVQQALSTATINGIKDSVEIRQKQQQQQQQQQRQQQQQQQQQQGNQ